VQKAVVEEDSCKKSPNLVFMRDIVSVLRLKHMKSADPFLEISVSVAKDSHVQDDCDGVHDHTN